jgi:hypothetical protein
MTSIASWRNGVRPALLAIFMIACAGSTENGGNPTGTAGASATAGTTGQGTGTGGQGTGGSSAGAGQSGVAGASGTAGSGGGAGTNVTGVAGATGVAGTTGAAGRGGTTGNAGRGGTTGSAGRGGTTGMAGASGTTGSAGTGGGATPIGPGLTDVGTFTSVSCTITPTVMTASGVAMVGIATFTTDLSGAERAIIQFGKTTTYTLEAPVNWADTNHRTLLLGMPGNTTVHYRVVVIRGTSACVGADATYMTGTVSGAPANLTPTKGSSTVAPAPGFIIAENQTWSYIINQQGEVVWAHKFPVSLSRTLMSFDGNYMYGREVGPFNASTGGAIYRVGMDGSGELKLPVTGGTHHDLTVTPTGIAYPAKQAAGGCDSIYVAAADGSNSHPLVDLDVVFSKFALGPGAQASEKCHVNAIRYYKDTDTFSVSDREKDAIAFVSSTGTILGSIGATPTGTTPNHAKAEGADSTTSSVWRVQHGHDQYAPDKIVVWSNGPFSGGTSHVLHYTINGATAKLDWQYTGTGTSPTLSDVQHLPNGNFLTTCSQTGAVHEIDPSQKLVQSWSNLSRGYTLHRTTLYGPPPGR